SFAKPTLDHEQISANATTKVSVTVTNTGSRAGDQVVQMYIHHPVSSVVQPVSILRGFKRVHLEPGTSTTVSFDVGPEQLSILNAHMQRTVEPGPVGIMVGASSAETSSVRLTISH